MISPKWSSVLSGPGHSSRVLERFTGPLVLEDPLFVGEDRLAPDRDSHFHPRGDFAPYRTFIFRFFSEGTEISFLTGARLIGGRYPVGNPPDDRRRKSRTRRCSRHRREALGAASMGSVL
jgi:hypothetical protein